MCKCIYIKLIERKKKKKRITLHNKSITLQFLMCSVCVCVKFGIKSLKRHIWPGIAITAN